MLLVFIRVRKRENWSYSIFLFILDRRRERGPQVSPQALEGDMSNSLVAWGNFPRVKRVIQLNAAVGLWELVPCGEADFDAGWCNRGKGWNARGPSN